MTVEYDNLDVNSVFLGLARPPMYAGVTHDFMLINAGANLALFIATGSFMTLLAFAALHVFGRACCAIDANIFSILLGWARSKSMCRNRHIYSCSKFDCY